MKKKVLSGIMLALILANLLLFTSGIHLVKYKRTGDNGDFASLHNNSTQLIIGVDNVDAKAYENIVNVINGIGGKVTNTISINDEVTALIVETYSNTASLIGKKLQATGLIRYVEPNKMVQAQLIPNDPSWNLQWGPQKIEADWAWNTTVGRKNVLVAVVDTGIYYLHPDLVANYVGGGYDWVNNDTDPVDDNGHGTHCAGIIAATINNSVGIAGLAQVRVMAEKVLDRGGSGYWEWLAKGIIHAVDHGAKIISMSLGGGEYSELVHDAIKYAYSNGVLLVAAAGNDNRDSKMYPAAYDEVIAVAATNKSDTKAKFSNWGDWIELAAPGVDIYSTVPAGGYESWSGTSMACPHVSGVAALIWSQFSNASRDWVRAKLRYTAVDLGDKGFDVYYGYGRINASKAIEPPPEHDLLIFEWKKPRYIQPGDIALFSLSVLNFGANDEQNVTVQLLVDGNLADSITVEYLSNGTLANLTLSWNPLVERLYNVTLYVVPVAEETVTQNNLVTTMFWVRRVTGFVLFDQTRCAEIRRYSVFVTSLTDRGYVVDTFSVGSITPDLLACYDVLVLPTPWISEFSGDEIEAMKGFVLNGGGLFLAGEYYDSIYNPITSFAGINWTWHFNSLVNLTKDITPHEITFGVEAVHLYTPLSRLIVNSPAEALIRDQDPGHPGDVMLAVSEIGGGRVVCVSDEDVIADWGVIYADDLLLVNNIIDWLNFRAKYEHELFVKLDAPSQVEIGKTALLNATIYNNGFNIETNVELRLLINGTVARNVTIAQLANGTKYTVNHPWTPNVRSVYNVTAYVPPLSGENVTGNNIKTRFVSVKYSIPPDIAVTNITITKNVVGQGYSTSINIIVENQGVSAETFNVTLWARTAQQEFPLELITFTRIVLIGGSCRTLGFKWDTADFSKDNYTLSAYAWRLPEETDTDDNFYSNGWVMITIPGDINGDKTVNILDCITLADHFGHVDGDAHTPGSKEWTECMNCDINCDYAVNILDAIKLSGNFGRGI